MAFTTPYAEGRWGLHEPALEMIAVGWGEVRALDATLAELAAFPAVRR